MRFLDGCSLLGTGDIPIPTEKSIFSGWELEKHLKIGFYFSFIKARCTPSPSCVARRSVLVPAPTPAFSTRSCKTQCRALFPPGAPLGS